MADLQTKTISAVGSNTYHKFTLKVTEKSIKIPENASPMKYEFSISRAQERYGSWSGWGNSITYNIKFDARKTLPDGTKEQTGLHEISGSIPAYDGTSTVVLKSGDLTDIVHEDNGTKTINISFQVTDTTGQSYTCGNASQSGTMELTKIPRASNIAVSDTNLGSNVAITIGKAVETFTSTLRYEMGDLSGTIVENYQTTPYVWAMPTSLINSIKETYSDNNKPKMTIYCKTYDGDTQVGDETSTEFSLVITDKPTISSIVRTERNASISSLTTKVIKSASQNRFTFTATPPTGTTIKNYVVECGDGQVQRASSTTNVVDLDDIQYSYNDNGTLKTKFICYCIDNRGNESERQEIAVEFIDYKEVSISKTNVVIKRTNATSDDAIIYANGTFYNGNIGSTSNTITFKARYRLQNTSEWSNWYNLTTTYSNDTFTVDNQTVTGTFDYQENYEFEMIATDIIGGYDDYNKIFANSNPFAKWHKNGLWVRDLSCDRVVGNLYVAEDKNAESKEVATKEYVLEKTQTTYSEDETEIGLWLDDETLYKKTIYVGYLPNKTYKAVQHNISDLKDVILIYGSAKNGSIILPLPHSSNNGGHNISLYINGNDIVMEAPNDDRSNYTGYVTIIYTKNIN